MSNSNNSNTDYWLPGHSASKFLNISPSTLRRWDKQGLIETTRTPTNYRVYNVAKFKKKIESEEKNISSNKKTIISNRVSYIYTRVSSQKQKNDLKRQIDILQKEYPEFKVISDVGSGINFSRKGLQRLFQQICYGMVEKIVCTHRDRLCRFGFEFLEFICKQHQTELLVHFQTEDVKEENELAQDILAINTVFICKLQGRRSAENRRIRREQQSEKNVQERNERSRFDEKPLYQNEDEIQFTTENIIEDVDWML